MKVTDIFWRCLEDDEDNKIVDIGRHEVEVSMR